MTKFRTAECLAEEFRRMLEEQRPEDLHLDYKEKRSLLPTSRGGGGIDKQKRAEDLILQSQMISRDAKHS